MMNCHEIHMEKSNSYKAKTGNESGTRQKRND